MAIDIIKTQINTFLSTGTPEVMAIKGAWGVGKTFSWKKFLKEAKNSNNIYLNKYSYVSLFGINSLEAFKYSIFENIVDRDLIGTEANIDTFKTNTASLLKSMGRKTVNLFKSEQHIKGFATAIDSLSFLSLNKSLICIDDLERKGDGLEIKDILGLVSLLKEQKECKIIILLNDGETGLDDYSKYKEKVIDSELTFSPTAEECAAIAFDNNSYELKTLGEHTVKLGIKNIRVLKKIERMIKLATPLINEYEKELKSQVIHSLTLFSWCYFCSNSDEVIPTLEFVTNSGYSFLGIGDEEEGNDIEKKWRSKIQDYNYQLTDDLDLVLAESVKTGYIVEPDFKREAVKKNDEILAAKSEGSFSKAWELYHDSFDNNADEVISTLYDRFKANVKHISVTNLNGTATLFRELGEDKKATEIIDFYIQERKGEHSLFNLKENNFFGDIKDAELIDKFDKIYESSIATESPTAIPNRIVKNDGWNQSDEVVLGNMTVDDYYDLFKNEKGRNLTRIVNACLRFGQFSNPSDQQSQIATRATDALKRIATESEINRRRVLKFGIELDEHA